MPTTLDGSALMQCVLWPDPATLTDDEVRRRFNRAERFVDFDNTLAYYPQPGTGHTALFATICGVPTHQFLKERPYIIQTWTYRRNLNAYLESFFTSVALPPPLLVICPPSTTIDGHPCMKDFAALGLTGILIIDDEPGPHDIHAPGCTVVSPR